MTSSNEGKMNPDLLAGCKKRAAEYATDFVRDGQVVGLGTGSTAKFTIEALGLRMREGLTISGVPTSVATERLALAQGIPIKSIAEAGTIDITIDGADEVDSNLDMIKGGGGALTREKLVALASRQRIMVVDETKLVTALGLSFKLPVEVLPFAWSFTSRLLGEFGCAPELRLNGEHAFETDNGNYILDCKFESITDPAALEKRIKLLPGVVENGLFVGICDLLVIGFVDRVEERRRGK